MDRNLAALMLQRHAKKHPVNSDRRLVLNFKAYLVGRDWFQVAHEGLARRSRSLPYTEVRSRRNPESKFITSAMRETIDRMNNGGSV